MPSKSAAFLLASNALRRASLHAAHPIYFACTQAGLVECYKDLLAIETVATLNAGFCYFHLKRCPAHPQLLTVCREVLDLYNEIAAEVAKIEVQFECADLNVSAGMGCAEVLCSGCARRQVSVKLWESASMAGPYLQCPVAVAPCRGTARCGQSTASAKIFLDLWRRPVARPAASATRWRRLWTGRSQLTPSYPQTRWWRCWKRWRLV